MPGPTTKPGGATRTVACYHCGRRGEALAAALSTACPGCGRHLNLRDVVLKDGGYAVGMSTCGTIVVERRARVVTRAVAAGASVEVHGELAARVSCAGRVLVARGARLKGDCKAGTIRVEAGAIIEGGFFEIGGSGTLPACAPGSSS